VDPVLIIHLIYNTKQNKRAPTKIMAILYNSFYFFRTIIYDKQKPALLKAFTSIIATNVSFDRKKSMCNIILNKEHLLLAR